MTIVGSLHTLGRRKGQKLLLFYLHRDSYCTDETHTIQKVLLEIEGEEAGDLAALLAGEKKDLFFQVFWMFSSVV